MESETVIGVIGAKRSGKNTFADMLAKAISSQKPGAKISVLSWADPLREMAATLNPLLETGLRYKDHLDEVGYEEAKDHPEFRRTLQVLGTDVIRNHVSDSYWVDTLMNKIAESSLDYVIVPDTRFDNEARAILDRGGFIFRVDRDGTGEGDDHASEAEWSTMPYTDKIRNNGGLDDLAGKAHMVASAYLLG